MVRRSMDVQALESEATSAIAAPDARRARRASRVRYLGRKSDLKLALREVRDRETGMALNAAREQPRAAVDERRGVARARRARSRACARRASTSRSPARACRRGHLHLITQIRREVEDIFLGLGYEVVDGREVETVRHNFDALNLPPWHPARSTHDTFFLDDDTAPAHADVARRRSA